MNKTTYEGTCHAKIAEIAETRTKQLNADRIENSGPYRAEMLARMDQLQRGDRVLPPCDRCRRLHMDCLKSLTVCQGCTKKHAKCSWEDVSDQELRDNPYVPRNEKEEVVELLLDSGADVNAQSGRFGNALQAASIEDYENIVRLLLEKGTDVNAQSGEYDNAH